LIGETGVRRQAAFNPLGYSCLVIISLSVIDVLADERSSDPKRLDLFLSSRSRDRERRAISEKEACMSSRSLDRDLARCSQIFILILEDALKHISKPLWRSFDTR